MFKLDHNYRITLTPDSGFFPPKSGDATIVSLSLFAASYVNVLFGSDRERRPRLRWTSALKSGPFIHRPTKRTGYRIFYMEAFVSREDHRRSCGQFHGILLFRPQKRQRASVRPISPGKFFAKGYCYAVNIPIPPVLHVKLKQNHSITFLTIIP